jgi:hypothetical protein
VDVIAQGHDARGAVLEALNSGPLSGYEIARRCEIRVRAGSSAWLYPVLYRLETDRVIVGSWRDNARGERRLYSILNRRAVRAARPTARPNEFSSRATPNALRTTATGTVSDYLDRMTRALRVSSERAPQIRAEIEGHLTDAGVIGPQGLSGSRAADAQAVFGPAEEFALAISGAQGRVLGRNSLPVRPVLRTLAIFGGTAVVSIFLVWLLRLALETGLNVVAGAETVSGSPALNQRQLIFPLVVAAFLTSRFVAGRFLDSHNRRTSPRVIAGAAILAAATGYVAVTTRTYLDALTVAVLLAAPAAIVLGALRPVRYDQQLVSRRGIAAAALLSVAVIAAPLNGVVGYSGHDTWSDVYVGTINSTDLAAFDHAGWSGSFWTYQPDLFGTICVEERPLVREGWLLKDDPATTGYRSCRGLDAGTSYPSWNMPMPAARGYEWLLVVSDAQARVLTWALVMTPSYHGSVIGWLTGQPGD